jgi:hypothetical protein
MPTVGREGDPVTITQNPDDSGRNEPAAGSGTRRLRAACDACHNAKIKCSGGGVACTRCIKEYVRWCLIRVWLSQLTRNAIARYNVDTAIEEI